VRAFQRQLEDLHISVTLRREMGDDIRGACGQLRRAYLGGDALAGQSPPEPRESKENA
jgi:23S rRNA (adenine2503-C2)-methyltransferase